MKPSDFLKLAAQAVPEHLRAQGRVVSVMKGPALAAMTGTPDLSAELAKELNVPVPPTPDPADSADVEYREDTPLGVRSTVVQIRGGKVAKVVKSA